MKKILFLITFLLLIFSLSISDSCYADTVLLAPSNTNNIAKQYIRTADTFSKNIELLARNSISVNHFNKIYLDEYVKGIDFLTNQINTTKNSIQSDLQINKKDKELTDTLLALNSIFANYKYALSQLSIALQTDDPDINYRSLTTYFSIMDYTDQQLAILRQDFLK